MYGKLPFILLLSIAACWLSPHAVNAQAPFTGGPFDGEAAVRLTVSTCVAVTANPYAGGPGSTAFHDSALNSICAPALLSPYSGGNEDGYANGNVINTVCYPTILLPYSGGIADGFAQAAIINSTCASVIIEPYSGGIGDGFAQNAIINSTCVSVIIEPYSGGIGDGFAENAQIVSICSPILIDPYSGGVSDGFSEATLIQSVCYPAIFSIFSGGEADGGADANLPASLGFNVPPPATTAVCENAQAFIGLAPGAPSLTYQWEMSTNGGSSYSSISNSSPYSGATDDTLWINPVTNAFNGNLYRVLVSYPGCVSGYSPISTIAVGLQPVSPTILKNPNVGHVCPGTDVLATFNPGSGGAGTVTDSFEYSINAGSLWSAYSPGSIIATNALQGINIVKIRAYRIATGQGCITPAESTANWTVAGVGYWVGVTSPDWNTPSNWGCGVIPTITTDVTIPEVQLGNNQPNVFNIPDAYARDLTIEPNASVTTYFGYNLELHGDLQNDGISSLGIGTVKFAASIPQSIEGATPSDFAYVEVTNNSAPLTALTLNQDITVSDEFKISNGMVNLNARNIDLGSTGMLTGETETSRITGSAGQVKSIVNMPAVSTTYTNIHGMGLDITTGATAAPGLTTVNRGHFTYEVEPGNTAIERYFEIEPVVNSNLDVTMRVHYFDAELAGHDESSLVPWRSADQGLTWAGQSPLVVTRDVNSNWVQQTGINAFSLWTLDEDGGALPVELLEFTAWPQDNVVRLRWSTAIEINNDYFAVERSSDALNFTDILETDGAGNSTQVLTYNETDKKPLPGISYYRLRQTDFDGTTSRSRIVAVSFDGTLVQTFDAFVGQNQDFNVLYKGTATEQLTITVYDATGRIVARKSTGSTAGNNKILVENQGLAAGVYAIELRGNDFRGAKKLFVR